MKDYYKDAQKKVSSSPTRFSQKLRKGVRSFMQAIYPEHDSDELMDQLFKAFWPDTDQPRRRSRDLGNQLWSERDSFIITYGNTFTDGKTKPLDLLYDFVNHRLDGSISGVHILPYFPYTSDDGFAITDYYSVNESLGGWEDIQRISDNFNLMSDLVINHCSSESTFFKQYLAGNEPYDKFFFEATPDDDLSMVVRPRAHPLLKEVETAMGTRYVWCTFSHDQVDFNFANPQVLMEFLRILRFHISKGVRTLRLDAIAYLWKEVGSPSIHLQQTHDVVRLLRLLADYNHDPLVLITETNVPKFENLSYFGNRNEAHVVYNFSLPPLLLHGLLNGTSRHLNAWQMSMPPAQMGCAYFNFTASHDGIGVRPAEGLLSDDEIDQLIDTIKGFGGLVSMRTTADGNQRPYEINTSLYDALKGTIDGEDQWQLERFLCCQTIAMGLEGIPAFYVHSLLATPNDHASVQKTRHNRTINRHQWHYPELQRLLDDPDTQQAKVFAAITDRVKVRARQPAFHPNATQFTLQLGDSFFGFWRQGVERTQSIFAVHNLTAGTTTIPAISLNLISGENWVDLLTGESVTVFGDEIEFAPYQCRWISNAT